jgi:hypothetical protein
LFDAHREQSQKRAAKWLIDANIQKAIIRSTWILHGREVLYSATRNPDADAKSDEEKEKMVQIGLGYLRAALRGITDKEIWEERFLKALYTDPVAYA